MKPLNENLVNAKKDKHFKLSGRFIKLLKSGTFKRLSRRKQYRIVERIKKLERQLKDQRTRYGFDLNLNFKHWAIALALGVVSFTASGQEVRKHERPRPFKKEIDLTKIQLEKSKSDINARTSALSFNQILTLGTPPSKSVIGADFDGDGDTEILYAAESGKVYLLDPTAGGQFEKRNTGLYQPAEIDNVFTGDYDNDGDLDVFYTTANFNYSYQQVSYTQELLLNDGAGNFTPVDRSFTSSEINRIFDRDIDGDGDIDLIYDNWNSQDVYVAVNDTASFTSTAKGLTYINQLLEVTDVDGDGDFDLVVYEDGSQNNSFQQGIATFLNDGFGSFSRSNFFLPSTYWIGKSKALDVDLDGDIDMIVSEWLSDNTSSLNTLLNDGAGNFSLSTQFTVPNEFGEFLDVKDLDGDNDPELIISIWSQRDESMVLTNDGTGAFSDSSVKFSGYNHVWDDFDKDGDFDVAAFHYADAILYTNNAFQFSVLNNSIIEMATATSIDITDINRDGINDFITLGASKVWLNSGGGTNFTISQKLNSVNLDHELVDLNGDGIKDLAAANLHIVGAVYINSGSALQAHDTLNINLDQDGDYSRVTSGDIDGDGDIDLAFLVTLDTASTYNYGQQNKIINVFKNDGTGKFTLSEQPDVTETHRDLDFGDIDGDNDGDVIIADDSLGVKIVFNDGLGNFNTEDSIMNSDPTVSFAANRVKVADLDGDSDLDIYVANEHGNDFIFKNDGAGNFTEAGQIASAYTADIDVVDMDNDGDVDLLLTEVTLIENQHYTVVKIWSNDGAGNFSDSGISMSRKGRAFLASSAAGDLDNDGDMDIVTADVYSQIEVWQNQLAVPSQLGQDSTILARFYEVNGGETWTNNTNWLQTGVAEWFGVKVANDRIVEISLPDNNVTGSLVPDIMELNALNTLNLSNNKLTGIPDLTVIDSLATADVSGNNLQFGSLEKNANLSFLVYSPQDSVGLKETFSYPVHSDFTLSETVSGTANKYQWYFEGTAMANDTTASVTVTDMTSSKMGKYYVEVTNPLVPDLILYSYLDQVNATASVSGKLMDESANSIVDADVVLLRVTSTGKYDTTGIVTPDAQGAYTFTDVVLAKYQVLADPDTITYPDLLPSYYLSSILWEEADTIDVVDITSNIDITVVAFVDPVLEGTGEISGIIEEEEEAGRVTARKRVKNAGVSVRRGKKAGKKDPDKGRMSEDYELVGYVKSDAQGRFVFNKLTDDTYRLNIQYPGYPMDTTSFIDIPIASGSGGRVATHNEKVQVEALVAEGKITVKDVTVVSIYRDINFADIKIYPNPSKGIIHIDGINEDVLQVKIFDIQGMLLETIDLNDRSSRYLNVSALEKGMYILKIYVSNESREISTEKIIIE